MKISVDYVDRKISRQRTGKILLPDGSARMVDDALAVRLFEHLGIPYETERYYRTLYRDNTKSLWWLSYDDFAASLQMKGGFFLKPNPMALLDKITEFLKANGVGSHFTRYDLALTTEENLFPLVKKIDFKNLLVKTFSRRGQDQTIVAGNSRMEICFYDKTAQLKSVRNQEYLTAFREKYPAEQLYRFEIRLKGKDTIEKIPSLHAETFHLGTVAKELLAFLEKRVGLPRKLKAKLMEGINAIE